MELFWDSSAIVAALLVEPHTAKAQTAWSGMRQSFAWHWLVVEVEAALGRRRANPATWANWRAMSASIGWLDLDHGSLPQLCAFNRALRLRAADAGHLFVFERAVSVMPALQLVTFDSEIAAAARNLSLPLWAD
jgi:predicted nucleic acid-binding protein